MVRIQRHKAIDEISETEISLSQTCHKSVLVVLIIRDSAAPFETRIKSLAVRRPLGLVDACPYGSLR